VLLKANLDSEHITLCKVNMAPAPKLSQLQHHLLLRQKDFQMTWVGEACWLLAAQQIGPEQAGHSCFQQKDH